MVLLRNTPENQKHLREKTTAYFEAEFAEGQYPVIVYAPSYQASSIENFALCEFLASHGFIVISSPSRGTETRWFSDNNAREMETQARDVEFLIREENIFCAGIAGNFGRYTHLFNVNRSPMWDRKTCKHPLNMKYAYTILYVDNVPETIAFYEKAFGFNRKFITPEKDYGELVSGETTIAFASIELGNSNFAQGYKKITDSQKPVGAEMAFTTENIETDFENAISAGATEFEALTEKPWGQKVGYVRDNNGFLIEICTPINAEKQ